MELVGSAIVAVLGALAGALIQRVLSRRQQRYRATLDLFRQYNAHDMLDARAVAWGFLRLKYPELNVPISAFYADSNFPHLAEYNDDITKIVYFWYLLHIMHRENELLTGLAREMFGLQFKEWETVLEPLARNTKERDPYSPEWVDMLLKNKLAWLKKGKAGS